MMNPPGNVGAILREAGCRARQRALGCPCKGGAAAGAPEPHSSYIRAGIHRLGPTGVCVRPGICPHIHRRSPAPSPPAARFLAALRESGTRRNACPAQHPAYAVIAWRENSKKFCTLFSSIRLTLVRGIPGTYRKARIKCTA